MTVGADHSRSPRQADSRRRGKPGGRPSRDGRPPGFWVEKLDRRSGSGLVDVRADVDRIEAVVRRERAPLFAVVAILVLGKVLAQVVWLVEKAVELVVDEDRRGVAGQDLLR